MRETDGSALGLATWFYEQAVAAGAAPSHHIRLAPKHAAKSLSSAAKLLECYPRERIEEQARRMFVRATTPGPDPWRVVTLEVLLEHWNAFDADRMPGVERVLVGAGARGAVPPRNDRIAEQLRGMVLRPYDVGAGARRAPVDDDEITKQLNAMVVPPYDVGARARGATPPRSDQIAQQLRELDEMVRG